MSYLLVLLIVLLLSGDGIIAVTDKFRKDFTKRQNQSDKSDKQNK